MRLSSFLILVSTLIGLAAMAMPASAANPVGTAVAVRGGATAVGPEGTRGLANGADIFLGDKVETGVFGQVEIEFSDHTRLAVGANSSMVIDTYVMQTPTKLNSFGLTASRGAFRFLTGNSPKLAYRLKTPSATIGIRGTEFDLSVYRIRPTAMALYGGYCPHLQSVVEHLRQPASQLRRGSHQRRQRGEDPDRGADRPADPHGLPLPQSRIGPDAAHARRLAALRQRRPQRVSRRVAKTTGTVQPREYLNSEVNSIRTRLDAGNIVMPAQP